MGNKTGAPPHSRVIRLLRLIQSVGGRCSASDDVSLDPHWLSQFCDDYEPIDTFNQAEVLGLIQVGHDSDSGVSTAYITDAGRAALEGQK